MSAVRKHWPACPSDAQLHQQQRCILGIAHFVDGALPATSGPAAEDFFLQNYTCTKTSAWRADAASPCAEPLSFPKGALQLWRVYRQGFADAADEKKLLGLLVKQEKKAAVKKEKAAPGGSAQAAPKRVKREKR